MPQGRSDMRCPKCFSRVAGLLGIAGSRISHHKFGNGLHRTEPDGSGPGSGGNPGRGKITGLDESETSLASGVDSGVFGAWSLANDVVDMDEDADLDQVSEAEQQRTSLTDNGEPTPPRGCDSDPCKSPRYAAAPTGLASPVRSG